MRDTARILYVLKCLQEKSDEQHPMSTNQILEYLETHGITANRHTIPRDVDLLLDYGLDIVTVKSKQNLYFIGDRHFELPELKLLIDAVLSSKIITPKKSGILVKKLHGFASEYQQADLTEDFYIADRVKSSNESIYINTDAIQTAISQKKQITFRYYEYMADKSKELKHGGYIYRLSPYTFVWSEDKYYIFGYSPKHEKVVKFRVDRMCDVKLSAKAAKPRPRNFNIAEYCRQVFDMYDGRNATVELKCKNELMKVIIDKFGDDVRTEVIGGGWFKATADVCVSPTFFGWLFQFTGKMILLSPGDAAREYQSNLEKAIKMM